ncbi:MAG TPA: ABC transporter ATP-binding protein [Nitrososphaerales archaeon]|nr:ABC transporter ATP-binding protein [Nitrososphaerales archaeon]
MESISAGYGKLQILNDISLVAEEAKVTVVVGPNGSGKSTLLKTIAGLTTIYQGKVTFDGETISKLPSHEIVRKGLAYLPQTESVFTQLTVAENIRMSAYTVAKTDYSSRLKSSLEVFPQIEGYMSTKVQNLSGGERQMVAMVMALMRNPRVIMFDEPTANLSPKLSNQVLKTIASLTKERHITVVLVEQNAKRALEMGDRACLLVGGKKVFDGTARDLLSHQELAQMYLGLKTAQAS